MKRFLSTAIRFLLLFTACLPFNTVSAASTAPVLNFVIPLDSIREVSIGYRGSAFASSQGTFHLTLDGDDLVDSGKRIPLTSLSKLVTSLQHVYPGTRPVSWKHWNDDYPDAWVSLQLKDGRVVDVFSSSQFKWLIPWNVSVRENAQAKHPLETFISTDPAVVDAVSYIWQLLTGLYYPGLTGELLFDDYEGTFPATLVLGVDASITIPDQSKSAVVKGNAPATLAAFTPLLAQHLELQQLFTLGFTFYDAAFSLNIDTQSLAPVGYAGMFALLSPDRRDLVISTVDISFSPDEKVSTPLTVEAALQQINQRKSYQFLNRIADLVPAITYLVDLRDAKTLPLTPKSLECAANPTLEKTGAIYEAVIRSQELRFTFYQIPDENAWSIDGLLGEADFFANEALTQMMLKEWFPPAFAKVEINSITSFSTNWIIAFKPGFAILSPGLLQQLIQALPPETNVHLENTEKAGDYTFFELPGRTLVREGLLPAQMIYCGDSMIQPESYGLSSVQIPQTNAPRSDLTSSVPHPGSWNSLPVAADAQAAAIGVSIIGYLHALWSSETTLYYAEGWADGTDWTEPQPLGQASNSPGVYAYPDGEVHLVWGVSQPYGSLHVWRNAAGEWYPVEFWQGIVDVTQVIRDAGGRLHLFWKGSDGLDEEFVYASWEAIEGISRVENVSRWLGDIGNVTGELSVTPVGGICAAWGHPLNVRSYQDPAAGMISDRAGVFFACRQKNGRWSAPEFLGALGRFARTVQIEVDNYGDPIVAWQAETSLVSRKRVWYAWTETSILTIANPARPLGEFEPVREVRPSAELTLASTENGKIVAAWYTAQAGINLSAWNGTAWQTLSVIAAPTEDQQVSDLQFIANPTSGWQLIYFLDHDLAHAIYQDDKVTHDAPGISAADGIKPEMNFQVDTAGYVYLFSIPGRPRLVIFYPATSHVIPTRLPTQPLTATITPTQTQAAESKPTPINTLMASATPEPSPTQIPPAPSLSGGTAVLPGDQRGWIAPVGIAALLTGLGAMGWLMVRGHSIKRRKTSGGLYLPSEDEVVK